MPRVSTGADFLCRAVLSQSTSERYRAAAQDFLRWCDCPGQALPHLDDVDDLLCDYLHEIYTSKAGGGRTRASCTVYGLYHFFPKLRGRLHRSLQALRGWARLVPSKSYPPMPWEVACAVAIQLRRRGFGRSALAVVMAHAAYLRISEVVGLRFRDIADVNDPRLPAVHQGMCLALTKTKTGPNQWAQIWEPQATFLIRDFLHGIRGLGQDTPLFPFTTDTLRRHFKQACIDLGLDSRFVFHSLRHGRATHASLSGVPVEEIMRRGRWASSKSARTYIQSGPALALTAGVPQSVWQLGMIFTKDLRLSFALSQKH